MLFFAFDEPASPRHVFGLHSFEGFFENAVESRGFKQASLCQSAHVLLSLTRPPDWPADRVIPRQIISSTEEESN